MNSITKTCSVENCINSYLAKGLCSKHYGRLRSYGDVNMLKLEQHGLSGTPIHTAWCAMIQRTEYKNHIGYKYWGGKGVKVCNGWRRSLIAFRKDMGDKPTPKHSLDRINSNLNYSCGHCDECVTKNWSLNCRWATGLQQTLNRGIKLKNGYRGVYPRGNRWISEVSVSSLPGFNKNYHTIRLGSFKDIEQAALAYDCGAIFFYGQDAITNIL